MSTVISGGRGDVARKTAQTLAGSKTSVSLDQDPAPVLNFALKDTGIRYPAVLWRISVFPVSYFK